MEPHELTEKQKRMMKAQKAQVVRLEADLKAVNSYLDASLEAQKGLEAANAGLRERLEDCSRERHVARRHRQLGEGDTWEGCDAGICLLDRAALAALKGETGAG